jgi:hypothetical protein
MNWAAIGAIGEVAGAIAVVATLFYLASQIKQNTNALKVGSRRIVLEGGHTILFSMVENPKIVADIIKQGELDDENKIRLSAFLFALMRFGEFAWGQYREGAIDSEQWSTEVNVIRFVFDAQRTRDWWEDIGRGVFNAEFADFVDDILKTNQPTETMWQGYVQWGVERDT